MVTDQQLIAKARELADVLAQTPEVARFKEAEAKVNGSDRVQTLIKRIKFLQKEAVNCKHYGKTEALAKVEQKIDKAMEELDSIPVVQAFQETQVEVNDLLQYVTVTLANSVTDRIIESTDGDVLAGKTGSGMAAEQARGGCGY